MRLASLWPHSRHCCLCTLMLQFAPLVLLQYFICSQRRYYLQRWGGAAVVEYDLPLPSCILVCCQLYCCSVRPAGSLLRRRRGAARDGASHATR